MSAADDPETGGEFGEIARLFRPLTRGAAGAFDLKDDAAVLQWRAGCEMVVTKDAIVEGVHFPIGEDPALVARKLLRVNLSDLAAKGAEPFACFLAVAWPKTMAAAERAAFATGLGEDLERFGLVLMGGDTVSTPGPLTASLTAMGWVPIGGMIRRGGAQVGDLLMVSGTIGDGFLGLKAEMGDLADADGFLADRYRLPQPRLDLREALRGAHAAADVSDGLIADVGHIAEASNVGLRLDLDRLPLSPGAQAWLAAQPERGAALVALASGGDDYEIVCAAPAPIAGFTVIGVVIAAGRQVRVDGLVIESGQGGFQHT
jgi:thiamine-monophosphate kinase